MSAFIIFMNEYFLSRCTVFAYDELASLNVAAFHVPDFHSIDQKSFLVEITMNQMQLIVNPLEL